MIDTALIIAGGLGTRLRPLTYAVPKPLLPIGDKPIIEKIILGMKAHGIMNFIVAVNYKKEMIQNYLKDGKTLGVDITYIEEDEYTGTAGCLAHIQLDKDMIISNGDLLCDLNYNVLYEMKNKFDFVITSIKKEYKIDYGVLKYNEEKQLLDWEEKPTNHFAINAGIYLINAKVISFINKNQKQNSYLDMPDLWKFLLENKFSIGIYEHTGMWKDVGRMEDYLELNSPKEF